MFLLVGDTTAATSRTRNVRTGAEAVVVSPAGDPTPTAERLRSGP